MSHEKILVKTLLSLTLATLPALAQQPDPTPSISPEASAFLLSPGFARVSQEHIRITSQSGRSLRLVSSSILVVGAKKYVFINLATKFSADVSASWVPYGHFASQIIQGPLGEVIADGAYFKPIDEPPGGASANSLQFPFSIKSCSQVQPCYRFWFMSSSINTQNKKLPNLHNS